MNSRQHISICERAISGDGAKIDSFRYGLERPVRDRGVRIRAKVKCYPILDEFKAGYEVSGWYKWLRLVLKVERYG